MANVEPLLPGVGKPVSMSDTSPFVANINNIHISPASQFCYADHVGKKFGKKSYSQAMSADCSLFML